MPVFKCGLNFQFLLKKSTFINQRDQLHVIRQNSDTITKSRIHI